MVRGVVFVEKFYFMCEMACCVVCGDVGVFAVVVGACGVAYASRCLVFVLKPLYGC